MDSIRAFFVFLIAFARDETRSEVEEGVMRVGAAPSTRGVVGKIY